MGKKRYYITNSFSIPSELNSIEHLIFIGSWLDPTLSTKGTKPITIYGVDLLSRKMCPSFELFSNLLSEILACEIPRETVYNAEFIIPKSIAKRVLSDDFPREAQLHKEELIEIWVSIATYETIEYINQSLKKVNSKSVNNQSAKVVVSRLLQNFSTGQLWNLTYKSSQKTNEQILAHNLENEKASELILDILLEKGLLYISNNWKLAPFNRWGAQCKQSDLSKFFFERVLEISSTDGFSFVPGIKF